MYDGVPRTAPVAVGPGPLPSSRFAKPKSVSLGMNPWDS
jgi:hypothetical protein